MSGIMRTLPTRPLVSLSRSNTSQVVTKPLYKYQASLQKLIVPALKPALEKYVKSLEPLLTPEELEKSKKAIEEFQKPGGLGEVLHKRLVERSNSLPQGWLIDWWNDAAYFAYRDPVVVNVNYFFQFQDDPRYKTQTRRAAAIVQAALKYRDLVVSEQLEPELFKGKPMCMSQYKYMFNTCRVPLPNVDTTEFHDPHGNNFVCVMRKNQFFTFNLTKEGNVPLSTTEIEHQLERIKKIADANGKELPIGGLTVANRDVFADARQKLIALDPQNKASLSAIEKSVFIVCLDDSSPTNLNDTGRELWHGDGRNRFFDKALQFIVFENGKAGFNGEHSRMDGTPTFQLCDYVMDSLVNNKVDHGSPIVGGDLPEIQKLKFVINKEIENTIHESVKKFEEVVLQHDHNVLAFHDYGKETIKKYKMSPDAFVQMSIQLAYYKMFGRVRATYESAQTRKYLNGRTEVCRSVSKESTEWVKSMVSPRPDSERLALLKKAVQSQVSYMNDAVDANGCDRLLLGLRKLCRHDEKPSIFQDKGYQVSTHWNLSTSQITSEYFDGYGWGEVVPDGFGIAYMVKNNSIHYNVANLREFSSSLKLCQHLRDSLLEMKRICESEAPASKL